MLVAHSCSWSQQVALFRAIRFARDEGRTTVGAEGLRVNLLELEVLAEPIRAASLATTMRVGAASQWAGAASVK